MKKNNNKGFTFIELVLYIGILSVFMLAVTTLVGTVVSSNRKFTNKKKIQNEASETYDAISDLIMGATDVKIAGTAYIGTTTAGVKSYSKVSGAFIVPDEKDTKETNGTISRLGGNRTVNLGEAGTSSYRAVSPCYDIADIKSFGNVDSPSTDQTTYITADSTGKLYLKVNYAAALNDDGTSQIKSCTITYDQNTKKIYVYRSDKLDYIYDASSKPDAVLCKNVKNFRLQINPDTNSIVILLQLEDSTTAASYDVNGVVGIRNSYVLKKHTWD